MGTSLTETRFILNWHSFIKLNSGCMHLVKSTRQAGRQLVTWCNQIGNHLIYTIWSQWELALLKLVSYYWQSFIKLNSGCMHLVKSTNRLEHNWLNDVTRHKKSSDLNDLVSMGTSLTETRFILLVTLFHKTQFWLHASC